MPYEKSKNLLEGVDDNLAVISSSAAKMLSKIGDVAAGVGRLVTSASRSVPSKGSESPSCYLRKPEAIIEIVRKPSFLEAAERFDLENISLQEVDALLYEIRRPQIVEIKIREVNPNDEAQLWEFIASRKSNIRALVENSVASALDGNFSIKRVTYSRGCVLITVVMGLAGLALTALANWDAIKKNVPEVTRDIRSLLHSSVAGFSRVITNLKNKFQRWWNVGGYGFA
ncbi:MAG: hypothetical protein AAFZ17_09140 [Cyanobacteria bacterium J06650_10]